MTGVGGGRAFYFAAAAVACGDAGHCRRLFVMSETSLYPAVKRFLEAASFDVKGEVKDCDIVAVRAAEGLTLTIVEMKLALAHAEFRLQNITTNSRGKTAKSGK